MSLDQQPPRASPSGPPAASAVTSESSTPPAPTNGSASAAPAEAPAQERQFTFPSAYTILFLLLIVMAALTWVIPAGQYNRNPDGQPIPNTYHAVPPNPQKLISG